MNNFGNKKISKNESFFDEISDMLEKLFTFDDLPVEEDPIDKNLKNENNSLNEMSNISSLNNPFEKSDQNKMQFANRYQLLSSERPVKNKKSTEQNFADNEINIHKNKIFKNHEIKNNGITDEFISCFKGKLTMLIQNYNGSILLQNCLPYTNHDIISKLFFEICQDISFLMVDPYGNYFCPILYKKLKKTEKLLFLKEIQADFIQISFNSHGNYSLQSILENLQSEEEIKTFLAPLMDHKNLVSMLKSNNSTHVIEKIIITLPEDKIDFIYKFTLNNFLFLSQDKIGLFVVKKIIMNCKSTFNLDQLQDLIIKHFYVLIIDPVGNHVIQAVLEVFIYFN
jgi:hypothetical protein